jgi:hypothetical protein
MEAVEQPLGKKMGYPESFIYLFNSKPAFVSQLGLVGCVTRLTTV